MLDLHFFDFSFVDEKHLLSQIPQVQMPHFFHFEYLLPIVIHISFQVADRVLVVRSLLVDLQPQLLDFSASLVKSVSQPGVFVVDVLNTDEVGSLRCVKFFREVVLEFGAKGLDLL